MTAHRLAESSGWIEGITHHQSPNFNWGMMVPSGVLGVVMHTMVGDLPGTDTVFMNPSYQASAHFGVAQDGEIIQWVSVRGGVAWHAMAANYNWYGIEHADAGNPGNPLTGAQLSASAQLVEFLSRDDVGRFPLQEANSTTAEGYGVHYMGGAAWGGHSCPQLGNGTGPRAGQRLEILRRAHTIRAYGEYPAPVLMNPVRGLTTTPRYTQADIAWQPAPGAAAYLVTWKVTATGVAAGSETVTVTGLTLHNLQRATGYTVTVLAQPADAATATVASKAFTTEA